MKKLLSFSLVLMAALSLAASLAEVEKITLDALKKDQDKYNEKVVEVTGFVASFQQKTSQRGNKYFKFILRSVKGSSESAAANIYGQNEPTIELKDGLKVTVTGTYRKEKVIGDFTYKNEIDCTVKKDKPFGIKEAK